MLGYLPIGFAFGVLASSAGISPGEATAMSVLVFAGSAQLVAVQLLGSAAGAATLVITVLLITLRHLLMSASLAPFLSRLKSWQQALFCFQLTDETFAVHSTVFRSRGVPSTVSLFAVNVSAHLAWIASSFLGAWVGHGLTLDTAVLGLDYALPAMFIALLVLQLQDLRRGLIALLAAGFSLFFFLAGLGHWHIILATVAASTAGLFLFPERSEE